MAYYFYTFIANVILGKNIAEEKNKDFSKIE